MPRVIQSIDPFISTNDIDKGAHWASDLSDELEGTDFGVACLLPENLVEPWIQFEAGAVSRTIQKGKKGRVAPVLFGVQQSDLVDNPLGWFQSTNFDKEDMRKLMEDINRVNDSESLKPEILDGAFEKNWADLEGAVRAIMVEKRTTAFRAKQEKDLDEIVLLGKEQMKRLIAIEEKLSNLSKTDVRPQDQLVILNFLDGLCDFATGAQKSVARIESELAAGEQGIPARLESVKLGTGTLMKAIRKAQEGGGTLKGLRSAMPDLRRSVFCVESL